MWSVNETTDFRGQGTYEACINQVVGCVIEQTFHKFTITGLMLMKAQIFTDKYILLYFKAEVLN